MVDIFENRRSVNFFDKTKDISNDLLKKIIERATLAPSAFNLQPWEIIAVRSEEAKQKLFETSNRQPKILEVPVTLIILGDKEGFSENNSSWKVMYDAFKNEESLKNSQNAAAFLYGSTEERKIKFAESNAGLLAMSIMYAVKEQGLDSHPMSGIDFEGIAKAFDIDSSKSVVMTIAIGYHDDSKEIFPRLKRKSFDEIVKIV